MGSLPVSAPVTLLAGQGQLGEPHGDMGGSLVGLGGGGAERGGGADSEVSRQQSFGV